MRWSISRARCRCSASSSTFGCRSFRRCTRSCLPRLHRPLRRRPPVPSTLPLGAYVRLPLLVLAAVLALGFDLGGYPLFDPDEGRNAEVAREMAETNDFVLPHLDGLPYLDKPIVYFAAAAVTMKVLGPNETAARLPALLFTIATLVVVVRFSRRRWAPDTRC